MEEILMIRVAQGDVVAFDELYQLRQKLVLNLANYLMSGNSFHTAEDVAQEIWIRIWKKASSYEPRGTFRSWIVRLIKNQLVDSFRHEWRERDALVDLEEGCLQDLVFCEEPEIPDRIVMKESLESVYAAMSKIPKKQASILRLHLLKGLSHDQLAAHLGEPLGTVKGRLRLAQAAVRKLVGSEAETAAA